eukprot:GHVT01088527.1.p1 GENE.GHVT01088527.1~~GHVT01088527.1.p1  ORF type:complete len:279 (+),score=10.07 GHVT01088527.1:243-1079(+)
MRQSHHQVLAMPAIAWGKVLTVACFVILIQVGTALSAPKDQSIHEVECLTQSLVWIQINGGRYTLAMIQPDGTWRSLHLQPDGSIQESDIIYPTAAELATHIPYLNAAGAVNIPPDSSLQIMVIEPLAASKSENAFSSARIASTHRNIIATFRSTPNPIPLAKVPTPLSRPVPQLPPLPVNHPVAQVLPPPATDRVIQVSHQRSKRLSRSYPGKKKTPPMNRARSIAASILLCSLAGPIFATSVVLTLGSLIIEDEDNTVAQTNPIAPHPSAETAQTV